MSLAELARRAYSTRQCGKAIRTVLCVAQDNHASHVARHRFVPQVVFCSRVSDEDKGYRAKVVVAVRVLKLTHKLADGLEADFHAVASSAQNAYGTTEGHFEALPSQTLMTLRSLK